LRRHIPPILFLLSLAILGVALGRPQTEVSFPHIEGTVILAFDVSGSMAANDFKPTRMEAAKTAAKSFVDHQPSTVRIGVVAFSDNGLTVQTPTNDQDAILTAINRLAPQRGTSLASGILASLKAIEVGAGQPSEIYTNLTPVPTLTPTPMPQGTYTSADIVLLTDGENNENPDPLAAAQTAASRGVRIYTVGIGSSAGTNLHINGFIVHTQLDEDILKQISQITSGAYYNAQSEQDLIKIYNNLNPQLVVTPEMTEVTSMFSGASILLMLIGGMFSLLWFSRLP
jgi:Ca-activated chloride channel family protein